MVEHPGAIRTASGREAFAPENDDEGAPVVRLYRQEEVSENFQTASLHTQEYHSMTTETPDFQTPVATPSTIRGFEMHQAHPEETLQTSYLDDQGKEQAEELDAAVAEHTGALVAETRHLSRSNTRMSEHFEPLSAAEGNRLTQLAKTMSRPSQSRRSSHATGKDVEGLERQDTIFGLEFGDPVLDPNSESFDLYKWLRMTLRVLDDEGIKRSRSGLTFKNLNVSGRGAALQTQGTVASLLTSPLRIGQLFQRKPAKHILRNFDGLLKSGEMLIVLGRPGSGCSTFLKSLTGEHAGLQIDTKSDIHYNGIEQRQMLKEFKGEVIYNQEVDKHFPHLTVGETMEHAAALRMPSNRPMGASRKQAIEHLVKVVMACYGLSHTYNTKVGDDFVRGVSGGERKRVSIAEMALAGANVVAWDNSTRGLDSATALSFTKSLRQPANLGGSCHAVAIYQASQAIYDLFDRAVVLYEGREIFYGNADRAKAYFEEMGWFCPSRQTTGDFLTSVTNPVERKAREGFNNKVPRTPDEFEMYWRKSPEYAELQKEIAAHEEEYPVGNSAQLEHMRSAKTDAQANHVRPKSPYRVSIPMQLRLNVKRSWRRIWNDKASTFTPIFGNIVLALIIGSVFYGTQDNTAGFGAFGAALFFAILINALTAISEINSLYAQRPIVEKHKSYAFYHPWTEAAAGLIMDIPLKFMSAVVFNVILYFLVGLRRTPGQFFLFFLINFVTTFVMAAVFRTVAAVTKTVSQAMSLAGVLVLAIVIYTGFVVPIPYMKVWFSWIRWINPVFYAFEILVANQFHGVEFACSQFVPSYTVGDSFICGTRGAVAGRRTVNGDAYILQAYNYSFDHVWRNFGILLGFLCGFMIMYLIAVELNSSTSSSAEVLVFRRGHVPSYMQEVDKNKANDEELAAASSTTGADQTTDPEKDTTDMIPPQKDVFTWREVNYDIEIKGEPRRLLDGVSGWVKPGTLTALMGTSGAGKTTLLDVLAQRASVGVVTGSMFVNGAPLDSSFQRKTGYVQQQDLHLDTATVRESLRFSAMLRQPKSVSKKEKYDYVEDVIKMLNMEDFAEAVVGVPGEGLNVEQRKLLTIGVELAAKPKLLLFLDEPTSGLDSQSSWAIVAFLRKLADSGQAVLCTIHQPSAILFQEFDRLLFLRKGGKTVYFGDVGKNSRKLLDYFETNGARKCDEAENPAEYMLEIAADEKWVSTWKNSPEAKGVQTEIDSIHQRQEAVAKENEASSDPNEHKEFAMPFGTQLWEVTRRVFQQYWRMPSYIFAKLILSAASGLFIGFSFYKADTTQQGMQNVLYSIFMSTTSFSTLVQQIMPLFVTQRSLYEVRERPSKAYSWRAFLIANIVVEIPWQVIGGIVLYASYYFAVVGADQSPERQGLVLLFDIAFFIYASTFAHMVIAALPDSQTAGAIVTLLFSMTLIFNGVMQPPSALPGFWIFMYRVSPLTYWVSGIASTLLHDRQVICAQDELSIFNPPQGLTCGQYMQPYLTQAPGHLSNPDATSGCEYCQLSVADQFLGGSQIYWSERWRNFGLMWAYIAFNIFLAVMLYYFVRVYPLQRKSKSKTRSHKSVSPQPAIEKSDEKDDYTQSSSEEEDEKKYQQQNAELLGELPNITPTATARQRPTGGLYRQISEVGDSYLSRQKALGRTNKRNAHVF